MRGAAPAPDENAPGPGVLESLAVGVGKSGLETAQTFVRAANKAAKFLDPLNSPQHPTPQIPIPGETLDTKPEGTAEYVGAAGENILEFIAGDEAPKGLSLAERLGIASRIAKFAETSPKTAKALEIGITALRQGAVGGAQTLAHGGTPTQAAETAGVVSGASAGFGALGAGAGAIYRAIVAKSPAEIALAKEAAEKEGSALAQKIAGGELGTAHEVAQDVADQLSKASDAMHADYAQGLACKFPACSAGQG